MNRVLVVDDDRIVARFIETNLRLEGFDVRLAHDGAQALAIAADWHADLVLLDVILPDLDGFAVCRELRRSPRTANLPVILLTTSQVTAEHLVGLAAGADDYLAKPFDPLELVTRVRFTLRRTAEIRALSPLTGLPGNTRIEAELASRITESAPVAICYADLDNFKAYNDCYGFLRGDEVLLLLATTIKSAADSVGAPTPFVGHVGGDDFVVICSPDQAEPLCTRMVTAFDAAVPALHDPADVARGHLSVVDRRGQVHEYPLVGVSIGVATSDRRHFRDHRESVAVATEMKAVAKGTPGSSIAIDRRSDPASITLT
ncbi:MAG TPA: response regulator [Mycobacteriales bacterium]|nr:response regulator [Mycobacteriales bacterium]